MEKIRILVVDDHQIVNKGLEYFLNLEPDMQVMGTARDGQAGLEKIGALNPHIAVLDLSMPGIGGMEAIRLCLQAREALGIVVFSALAEEKFVYNALRSGARGYVVKGSSMEDLKQCIREVHRGGFWISPRFRPEIVSSYLYRQPQKKAGRDALENLSERELQVLHLMVSGKETEEIATFLNISGKTVAKHRMSLLAKLGVKNAVELTRFAIREGLVEA